MHPRGTLRVYLNRTAAQRGFYALNFLFIFIGKTIIGKSNGSFYKNRLLKNYTDDIINYVNVRLIKLFCPYCGRQMEILLINIKKLLIC
ncbi:MAG TPA: hypothetical protein DIV41_06595 [Ruminococcaceae bacterium]|nr:hypothetical protein [Oscillospiraceae bacterium]